MDKSWNFLKNNISKGEQNLLTQAMQACKIKINTYEEALKELENIYGSISYFDLLKKMSTSLNLSLIPTDLQSDKLVIGYIGYFLLIHDKVFRSEFTSKENLPYKEEEFKNKYLLKLKTSNVFWFKIAMYVFEYYQISITSMSLSVNKDNNINVLNKKNTRNSICVTQIKETHNIFQTEEFLPGVSSSLGYLLGGTSLLSIAAGLLRAGTLSVAIPVLGTAASVAKSIYKINKSINESFVERLPIVFTLSWLRMIQAYEISSFKEAKAILRYAIMNARAASNPGLWDDVRKGILQIAVKRIPVCNQDLVNCILSNKLLSPTLPLNVYIPQRFLDQIFKFDLKELVNFIYGFDVLNDVVHDYKLLDAYKYNGTVLMKDYCFPFTHINNQRYCLLGKGFKSLLTQLYYEIYGLDSKKMCLKSLFGHFNYIQLRNISDSVGNKTSHYAKYADKMVYIKENTVLSKDLQIIGKLLSESLSKQTEYIRDSVKEIVKKLEKEYEECYAEMRDNGMLKKLISEAEIMRENEMLKKRISELENIQAECDNFRKRLDDQNNRCTRVKHDLENLLGDIIEPIIEYVEFKDDSKVQNEAYNKFKDSIDKYNIFCNSWKFLIQDEIHGALKEYSIKEFVELFDNFGRDIDGVNLTFINQLPEDVFRIYVSECFKTHVLVNINSNLKKHAFVDGNIDRKLYIRISHDDVFVTVSIENNGCPIDRDNPDSLFDYRLPDKKGIGLSNIRDCMRHAKGDFRIESNHNSEYCTIYVLTFKIIN